MGRARQEVQGEDQNLHGPLVGGGVFPLTYIPFESIEW